MKVSIIIPTCDRGPVFARTLKEVLEAVREMDVEVWVVNDSKSSSPEIPESSGVSLLQNHGRGVASARNLGASKATGDLLLFIDDDILISRESFQHILEVHRDTPHLAMNPDWSYPPELLGSLNDSAFGRFLMKHRMTTFKGWYSDPSWQDHALFESRSLASFHLSLSREDFVKSGGYDEQFPFAGFEDYDFPVRLRKAGVGFRIDSRICVFHNEADRMVPGRWLDSMERRAISRAVAVRRGYQDLSLRYSLPKRWMLRLILLGYPLMEAMTSVVPNRSFADPVAFAWIGYLQAAKIFKGYSRGMKK